MRKITGILIVMLMLCLVAGRAEAIILTEDFEAPFPAWETGWLGTNSNLTNYYGVGGDRGNNPDGLWIGETPIVFDPTFGASLTSLDIDIANWTNLNFQVYDMSDNLLLDQALTPNQGAYTDPGTYWHLSTTSANGISRMDFVGAGVLGNTGIDNVVVSTDAQTPTNAVPEPASMVLFASGLVGAVLKKRSRS